MPPELVFPALAPIVIMLPMQCECLKPVLRRLRCVANLFPFLVAFVFKSQGKSRARQSKMEEKTVAVTSSVLREIKTVRQFAMEPQEGFNSSESETAKGYLGMRMEYERNFMNAYVDCCLEGGRR